MRKLSLLLAVLLISVSSIGQICMSAFTYTKSSNIVNFSNTSVVANAHYWWNFGDGTGSNIKTPLHVFPESGNYLVTLFAKDTITNCSDYYELWIIIEKESALACTPAITDSFFVFNGEDHVKIIDLSSNCLGYSANIDGGAAYNSPIGASHIIEGWKSFRFIARIKHYVNDTSTNIIDIKREAYKSILYNYSSAVNYHNCSANFEYTIKSQDSLGQRIMFKAMNSNAISYKWYLSGFGNPIYKYTDTISWYFPYYLNNIFLIGLYIEGQNGCTDTLFQDILIKKEVITLEGFEQSGDCDLNIQIFPNPFNQQCTFSFKPNSNTDYSLNLYNSIGQLVRIIENINSGIVSIDRRNLAAGLYFYQLTTKQDIVAVGKFIIQN